MKKDHELCRQILLAVEGRKSFDGYGEEVVIPNCSGQQISYHVLLLHEQGLLVAEDEKHLSDEYPVWQPIRLTNAGHEFVESIRSETIWAKAKEIVRKSGAELSFSTIQQVAIEVLKKSLGLAA